MVLKVLRNLMRRRQKKKAPESTESATTQAKAQRWNLRPPVPEHIWRQGRVPFRTKKYGLRVLQEAMQGRNDATVIPHREYQHAEEFSISDFEKPSEGRLVIRADPKSSDDKQDVQTWYEIPRLNIDLWKQTPAESERIVKKFMGKISSYARFIVHKVPRIGKYHKHFEISVDCENGFARIKQLEPFQDQDGYYFGHKTDAEMVFKIDPATGEWTIHDQEIKKKINPKILGTLKGIAGQISENAIQNEQSGAKNFHLRAVTYKNQPRKPEFYDLIFGLGRLDWWHQF